MTKRSLNAYLSKEYYQGQRGTLGNDKRVDPPGRYHHLKYVYTKQQNFKIHETKTNIPER